MILSMTGYGSASCVADGVSYLVEVRSVNHRYLKLNIRLPDAWQFVEAAVDRVLRRRLSRGSVSCTLRIRSEGIGGMPPLNLDVAQNYADALSSIRLPYGIQATIDLSALAGLPGVSETSEIDDETRQEQQRRVEQLTDEACDSLMAMRRDEGAVLRSALVDFCDRLREHLAFIQERAPKVVVEYKDRLQSRVATLMAAGGFELQQDALAREIAIYAERCDISEEITRFVSHLGQFGELCDRPEPVGRTLDFLAQELLREANTIASKSADAEIAWAVVEMKGLIDRLKEQVQNVE
ncbi:MAG: YicC family protein [Phycisphaerae bacterium]|nr:YicC family protein [Phycisphaerae bacterium]